MSKRLRTIFAAAAAVCTLPVAVAAAQGPSAIECVRDQGDFKMTLQRNPDDTYKLLYSAGSGLRLQGKYLYQADDVVLDASLACRFAQGPVLKCEGKEQTVSGSENAFGERQQKNVKSVFEITLQHQKNESSSTSVDGTKNEANESLSAVIKYEEFDAKGGYSHFPRAVPGIVNLGKKSRPEEMAVTPPLSAYVPVGNCKVTP
jgi:hypothetical protein